MDVPAAEMCEAPAVAAAAVWPCPSNRLMGGPAGIGLTWEDREDDLQKTCLFGQMSVWPNVSDP